MRAQSPASAGLVQSLPQDLTYARQPAKPACCPVETESANRIDATEAWGLCSTAELQNGYGPELPYFQRVAVDFGQDGFSRKPCRR